MPRGLSVMKMGTMRTDMKALVVKPGTLSELVDIIEREFGVGDVAARLFNKYVSINPSDTGADEVIG